MNAPDHLEGARPEPAAAFAEALRETIAARGLSLDRIRYHLSQRGHDLSIATLSYWQSGRSRPDRATSLAALGSLEEILGVPRGELARLLPPRRRRTASRPREPVTPLTEDGRLIGQLVQELGLSWNDGVERVSVHDLVEVGPDRRLVDHTVRELLRATRDGVDRYPVWMQYDDIDPAPSLIATKNCTIGKVAEIPERRLAVAELLLGRRLMEGDSVLVEYHLRAGEQKNDLASWERGCLHRMREMHLEVRFDPDAVPVYAEQFLVVDGSERVIPVPISGHLVTTVNLDFGPGRNGLRCRW